MTIYNTPATLSAFAFNTLMGVAGGMIGAYLVTRDPFWMMSGALGGIISAAAGIDLWWPPLAFVIGFIGASMMPFVASFIERMKIDDAVGAFTVHGFLGLWGVIAVGIVGSGYPALFGEADVIEISFMGQLGGAAVMALLGFVPGYAVSFVLKAMGMLRVPESAELLGLDLTKVPSSAYPESIHPSVSPAE